MAYKHDIFVSYAHVDNVPLEGVQSGWVTTFVNNLTNLLRRKLPRDNRIWTDELLAGNAKLTPALLEVLRETATFLVILSPNYLASEWCTKEREAFWQLIKDRTDAGSRVFLVECEQVPKISDEFAELVGYRFWVQEGRRTRTLGLPFPQFTDNVYFDRLLDLREDLALELGRIDKALARIDAEPDSPPELPNASVALPAELRGKLFRKV